MKYLHQIENGVLPVCPGLWTDFLVISSIFWNLKEIV